MKKLPLSQGYETPVDDDVFEKFQFINWHVYFSKGGKPYARSNKLGQLHRAIYIHIDGIDIGDDEVDHIDRNGLNNQRYNFRVVKPREQARNNTPRTKSVHSPYVGVSWKEHANGWRASTKYDGNYIHLGYFFTAEEAGMAYDRAILYYYGDTDILNFPNRKHEHDLSAPYERKYKTLKSTNKTGYRGVNQRSNKFYAGIGVDGGKVHLGVFANSEDAARAYDAYVIENGLPNPLNFPEAR
jgi:hypothetical protein